MDLRRVTDDLSVSDQITPEDMPALKAQGVTTLIINRPDAEVGADLASAAIAAAAQAEGIATRYVPFVPGQMTPEMVEAFADALAQPGAAHAYCRTGNRSVQLWAMTQAGTQPSAAIVAAARAAGYDIVAMAPALDARARR